MGRFTLRFVNFAWRLTGRSDEMRLIDAALCDPDSVNGKRKLTSLGSLVVGRDVDATEVPVIDAVAVSFEYFVDTSNGYRARPAWWRASEPDF